MGGRVAQHSNIGKDYSGGQHGLGLRGSEGETLALQLTSYSSPFGPGLAGVGGDAAASGVWGQVGQ